MGRIMRIDRTRIEEYGAYLAEPGRPPSRGGNTKAWHSHVLTIKGERYSFRALGSKKWVFVGDTVAFEWQWDATEKYRNIDSSTIETWDKNGNPVTRGVRGTKKWRTAEARMPASRREQRD